MRKYFIFTALFAALVSCSQEKLQEDPSQKFKAGDIVTLCANTGNSSKVSSSFDGTRINYTWDQDDAILVTIGGKTATFTLSKGAGTNSAEFTGQMPASGDQFDVQCPAETPDLSYQDYQANGLPKNKVLFEAKNCNGKSFSLTNQSASLGLAFKGKDITVGRIVVSSKDATPSFTCELSCGNGGVSLNENNPTNFFIVLPTGTYNFTVDVNDVNGVKICDFATTQKKQMSAGSSVKMDAKEVKAPSMNLYFKKGEETVTSHTWDMYVESTHVSPVVYGYPNEATVTYSSSDTNKEFVEIDSNTGAITAKKTTATPITVTAEASATGYSTTSVSYQLTISNSAPVENPIEFKKGGASLSDDKDTYDLISSSAYVSPTITSESAGDRTVTYAIISQSVENLATIDAFTGVVTINSNNLTGTVTVKATAAASTKYTQAEKTYTLDIIDSRIVLKKGEVIFSDSIDYFDLISSTAYSSPIFTKATGDDRTVTYAINSGDSGVASINTSTGAVTINSGRKTGSVTFTVTATAATGSKYTTTSTSYTLKVIDSELVFKKNGTALIDNKDSFDLINEVSTFVSPAVTLSTADGDDRTLAYSITGGSDIATVNSTTGAITFNTSYYTGDVTVKATATAGSGSKFTTREKTYTLSVSLTPHFVKLTSRNNLVSGATYIITNTESSYAFKGVLADDKKSFNVSGNTQSVSPSNDKIIDNSNLADCKLNISFSTNGDGDNYSFKFLSKTDYPFVIYYSGKKFIVTTDRKNSITYSNSSFQLYRESGSSTKTKYCLMYSNNSFTASEGTGNVFLWKYIGPSVRVTAISLNKSNTSISLGNSEQLSVSSFTPENATDQSVTWSSNNTGVATVDTDGKVTAVAKGTATITCKANGGDNVTATCSVTVTEGDYFTKVTSLSGLTSGDTYIITNTDSNMAFEGTVSSSAFSVEDNTISVTPVNNKIYDSETLAGCKLNINIITKNDEKNEIYQLKFIKANSSLSVYTNSKVFSVADDKLNEINESSGNFKIFRTSSEKTYYMGYIDNAFNANTTNTNTVSIWKYCIPVTAITLNKTAVSVSAGSSEQLTVSAFTPSNATDKSLTWSSSNSSVATVDKNGLVTAVAAGTATITCKANGGDNVTATCSVTVTESYFTKISTLSEITDGEVYIITNTDNKKAFAGIVSSEKFDESTNNSIDVSVLNNKIIYKSELSKCRVSFTKHSSGVYYILFVDVYKYFSVKSSSSSSDEFKASDTGMDNTIEASDSDGNFKIKANSNYLQYDTSKNYFESSSSSSKVNIWKYNSGAPKPVTGISLNATSKTISVNGTYQLSATITPSDATDKSLTWSSSNSSVATVDHNGLVTGVAAGTATITCAANDGSGVSATCNVTVTSKSVYSAVTGSTIDTSKDYLFVYVNGDTKRVFTGSVESNKGVASDVTIESDGTIISTSTIDGYAVKFVKNSSDDSYAIKVGNNYLYATKSGDNTYTAISTEPKYHTITVTDNVLKISYQADSTHKVCLCYDKNSSNKAFRYTDEKNFNDGDKLAFSLYAK